MQKWKKIGQIFCVDKNYSWMYSHASVPIAQHLCDDLYKIYFSCRNKNNESSIGYFIIDINNPKNVLQISESPVLEKGELGCFDDSGVMGSCILYLNNKIYLYYVGWNLGVTVPFRNSIGLAISEDNGLTFKRMYFGPIIDRTKYEPHFISSCCVIEDNGLFKIWYLSCTGWSRIGDTVLHKYHIKYAESNDAIEWNRQGIVAIDYKDDYEYAISVPRVIKEDNIYKMWFSSRATKDIPTYRIRYAESIDGINWIRKDNEVGIDVGKEGDFDSEMICYPFVFDHKGERYMLYNGNGYGKTGIGICVLDS